MDAFFNWLEKLATQPVGLVFIFGTALLFWLRLGLGSMMWVRRHVLSLPSQVRWFRISYSWWRYKPLLLLKEISDIEEKKDDIYLEYHLCVVVRAKNRDDGIAVVYPDNLVATLKQKRGVTLKYELIPASSPNDMVFSQKDEEQEIEVRMTCRFTPDENWLTAPIDFSKPYEITFGRVHAGIGGITDDPTGHGPTRLIFPQPRKRQFGGSEEK